VGRRLRRVGRAMFNVSKHPKRRYKIKERYARDATALVVNWSEGLESCERPSYASLDSLKTLVARALFESRDRRPRLNTSRRTT
jgi:hypothetical protein